jgi:Tfp pilus assembly protein PilF
MFYGIKSHSHLSYPWKQIESGVKVSESTGTSLPFREPLNIPTDAGFKFELVSEETQFKPHIHFFVNNNNLPPASNGGKKIVSSNQMSATNVSASRGSNVTSYPSSTNSLLIPVANAGTNQTVNENSTVRLVGQAMDPNPSAKLSLSWRQIAGPFVKLDNSDTANPTFTSTSNLRSDTQLKFLLIAKDDKGVASRPAFVTVIVKHVNLPVANAGQGQVVNSGYVVSLNGSKSRDPDGSISSYSWTQISGPAVRLESADTPTPTFTAPTVYNDTTLKFSLTVKDDKGVISNNHSIVSVTVKAAAAPLLTAPVGNMTSAKGGGTNMTSTAAPPTASNMSPPALTTTPSNVITANNVTAPISNDKEVLTAQGLAITAGGNHGIEGNYTQAVEYFDKALAIDPNYINALNGKGWALNFQGNYAQAIPLFDKVLAIDPKYRDALNNKGWALVELGNYTEALTYLDKALAIDPNYKYALNNKGMALNGLGKYKEAITYLDKALTIDPNFKFALNNKGAALQGLGQQDAVSNLSHHHIVKIHNGHRHESSAKSGSEGGPTSGPATGEVHHFRCGWFQDHRVCRWVPSNSM